MVDEATLRRRYKIHSLCSELSGLLIVLGLLIEIGFALASDKSWWEIGPLLGANGLIAIGVFWEIQFARWARQYGDNIQAVAEARAAEAQLALERFKAPRILTTEQHAEIREKLKAFAGTHFDTAMAQNSGEQADFLWQLHPVLLEAGWHHVDWACVFQGQQIVMQGPSRPVSGAVGASNVEIHLHAETRDELLPAATALIDALNAAGIATREVGFNTHNANPRAIHVLVGEKRG